MSVDPLESPLHAGIAGVELPSDEFDFGEGTWNHQALAVSRSTSR
jgi:hypothetical protein